MKRAILFRYDRTNHGTFGRFIFGGQTLCYTGEPPWRDNRPNRSCIPPGEYLAAWQHSPRFGWCYQVYGVSGRTHILEHPGNLCGDPEQGLKTHTLGCILPGTYVGFLGGQKAVLASRPAVRKIQTVMGKEPYILTII